MSTCKKLIVCQALLGVLYVTVLVIFLLSNRFSSHEIGRTRIKRAYDASSAESTKWLCKIPPAELATAKPRHPIIVISEARTGSNFFFNLLTIFQVLSKTKEFDLLSLYELFLTLTPDREFSNVLVDTVKSCHLSYRAELDPGGLSSFFIKEKNLTAINDFDSFLKVDMEADEYAVVEPVIEAFRRKYKDPLHLIRTIIKIPQQAKRAFFAFKIFPFHFRAMQTTPKSFIAAIRNESLVQPIFIVSYRRRMIEWYVSLLIAKKTGKWLSSKTTTEDAVTIKENAMNTTISRSMAYFEDVRYALESSRIHYDVFEYSRDLLMPDMQMKTVRRLKEILKIPIEQSQLTERNFLERNLKKQAQTGLSELVTNWKDVIEWGYGGEVEEWQDLFPGK